MSVRAKFQCQSVTNYPNGYKEVTMSAVNSSTGENADFAAATPNGSFKMSISPSTKAGDYFVPGKDYYLDIKEVE